MNGNLSGVWHNQHGSEMQIEVGEDGSITGSFRSGTGLPGPRERFPLTGHLAGDLISITVDFGKYDSMTSWTGHHGIEDGERTIYAMWHMAVRLRRKGHDQLWTGIWAGADTFRRGPSAKHTTLPGGPSHPFGGWLAG
jgi:hypothetical protein